MPFQAGAIVSQMTLDRSKFSASMKTVQTETKTLGKWVKQNNAQIRKLEKGLAAIGIAVVGAIAASVKAAAKQQDVLAQMDAVLTSTGHAAGFTKTELVTMATALQRVTKFGDEVIMEGQNLLLTFTKIGKKVFPDAIEVMLDMSTALGTDLKNSAIMLGKALNDPILGVTALRRVGVSLTEQQAEMIKKFVESGDIMSAQRIILDELSVEFGGSARRAAETFTGRLTQLKNIIGDLVEGIGFQFLPVLTNLAVELPKAIDISDVAQRMGKILLGTFQFIAQGIQGLLLAWHGLKTGVFTVAEAITKSLTSIAKGLLWIAKLTPGTEIFYAEKLKQLIKDLTAVSGGYREEKEKGIDTMANIIEKYEAFVAMLNKVKTGTKGTKEETKSFGETLTDSALPAARKLGDVMDKAVTEMESGAYRVRKSWEETFWKILSDAMLFTSSLSGLFNQLSQNQMMSIENEYNARKTSIENSLMTEKSKADALEKLDKDFEKRRIKAMRAQAIRTKLTGIMESIIHTASAVAEALPNIPLAIAVGIMGAAQTALIAAQPLPSYQRGGRIEEAGIVGEKGPEVFVPGTPGEILPLRERAAAFGPQVVLTFAPSFYLTSLDPQTARDVVRNQVGPELLEMFRTKIMLPEFQDALRIK